MTVSFVTFAHPPRYVRRLHEPGILRAMVESHLHPFDDIIVIHNQCWATDYPPFNITCRSIDLPREEFDPLLVRWKVNPEDARCEDITHGEGARHWFKVHVVNHLSGLENANADYIVFADCDTKMVNSVPGRSWVEEAIYLLDAYPHVLIVSPGDGGEAGGSMAEGGWIDRTRLTQNVSQQLFCCRAEQFKHEVNYDLWWDGNMNAPGGPFQEYYCLLEGRLWRYMKLLGMWRAILPDRWRYFHNSYWATDREPEGWGPYR